MIDKYDMMMFLDEDDGGGGGGEAVSRGIEVFEGDGEPQPPTRESHAEPQTPVQQAPPSSPPPAPTIDARQFATEFGNVLGQQFRPPPKEITVQDAKRMLNVWEPSPEWQAKYDNLETRQQAIAEQRDGLIRQADTIVQMRMKEMMDQVKRSYDPVVQYMRQNEARAGEHRFSTAYPQLSAPGLRPMLYAVAQNMLAQNAKFRDERHMFESIARGVESIIKANNPEFKLESGAAPKAAGRSPVRNGGGGGIPVTTPGSGAGGSGGSTPAPSKKPRGLAIWDS